MQRKKLQELADLMRETLSNAQKHSPHLSRSCGIPLHSILLALGYESRLVEMLGKRYGR